MSASRLLLLGLLGVALLTLACAFVHRGPIEAGLSARAAAALGGLPGAALAVSGRDVTLTGQVPTEAARREAGRLAAAVPGVRAVHNRLTVTGGAAAAAAVEVADGPGGLVVRGVVPSAEDRAGFLARVRAAFPGRELRDALTVRAGSDVAGLAGFGAALPALGGVEGVAARLEGGALVLRGRVPTAAERDRVEAALRARLPAGVSLRNELTVGAAAAADTTAAADQLAASGSADARVQAAEAALREALALGSVEFESGTATLTPQARQVLDAAADVFARFPGVGADVVGHTDSQGADAANLALSTRRAEAVRAYLAGRGLDAARFAPAGRGEAEPLADNGSAEGRARNRRVVFRLAAR